MTLVGLDRDGEIFECPQEHREHVSAELAKAVEMLAEALAERDHARDIAARLEAQLAQIEEASGPLLWSTSAAKLHAVREILKGALA